MIDTQYNLEQECAEKGLDYKKLLLEITSLLFKGMDAEDAETAIRRKHCLAYYQNPNW